MTEVLIYNSRIFYADHQVGNYCLLIREVYLISAVRARIYVHESRKCTVYRNYKNYNGGGAQYRALIGRSPVQRYRTISIIFRAMQ